MSSFFCKSRSVYDASSVGSSSTSLLICKEKESHSKSSGKDYSAAHGNLTSQYGASGQAPIHVSLPPSQPQSQIQPPSQPQSQPQSVQKVRAKEFGAQQNKYGAIGHGSMTSTI